MILSTHLMGAEDATSTALRVLRCLGEPIQAGPTQHRVGSGIGIALLPDDGMSPEKILRKADVALYRAKSERRSALRFFEAKWTGWCASAIRLNTSFGRRLSRTESGRVSSRRWT